MAGGREIKTKIKSVQNTRKVTRALEMVSASKIRKAQDRMKASRPYARAMKQVIGHLAQANSEYQHPYLVQRADVKRVGYIIVSSDRGLAGGLNNNLFRKLLVEIRRWQEQGVGVDVVTIGQKASVFFRRIKVEMLASVTHLGDVPHVEQLIGVIKVMLDGYMQDRFDRLLIFYTKFINTMKQEPVMEQLLPLSGEKLGVPEGAWDYIYEPEAKVVLDQVLTRYVEAIIYQALSENLASEQSARMVAMKAASDNANNVIDELTLIYNKSRQAAITQELSEIVAGAAAV